jgi:hypothetical protein
VVAVSSRAHGPDLLPGSIGPQGPGTRDRGLIWQNDQAPAGTGDAAAPLVN